MVKVAQIGVGYWGPNLLRNLVSNKKCEVGSVIELSSERRQFVQELYPSVPVGDNVEIVFADDSIAAVVIATPVRTHYNLVMRALNAGKHVLVEKPMATSVDEVEAIGDLANKNGLVAMVGHTFLYNEAVRYVKGLIDQGEIGEIRYIYSQRLNLGRIREDVNALWNLAPHDVSIIQYWLNEPEPMQVSMQGMSYVQDGIEDVVFLNILYPNNILANIHVSWLDPQKVRRITVVGSEKMVVYDDLAENKVTIYDKGIDKVAILGQNMDYDAINSFSFNHRSGDIVLPKIDWEEPLKQEIAHFLDCILSDIQCLTSTSHARNVVQILEVANKQNGYQ